LPNNEQRRRHVLYEQPRDHSLARGGAALASPAMIFTPQGLMLGAGNILVPAEGVRKLQSLQGQEQQILALLSAAYGMAVAPSVLGNIERAAKSWSEGDDFTAHIHLALTGLRALDDFPRAAHRLRMAKGGLDCGASPATCSKRCVSTHITSMRWKNATTRESRACPPAMVGSAGGGRAEIGAALQIRMRRHIGHCLNN
jgi:hypothetical protein